MTAGRRCGGEPLRPLQRPALAVSGLVLACCTVTLGGCAANPNFPECGGWRLAAADAGAFRMYGAVHCGGRADQPRRRDDVAACVNEGGDPAACRAAVYGTLAPRTTVNTVVQAPVPAGPPATVPGSPVAPNAPNGMRQCRNVWVNGQWQTV